MIENIFYSITIFTLYISIIVSSSIGFYLLTGAIGYLLYDVEQADERAEDVKFVITTIAKEGVRPALMDGIEHQLNNFPEYPLDVVIDEGADLEDELVSDDRFETVVVPDEFDCRAEAKGRAIQYFIETVIEDAQDYWYCFIDDDNKVLSDDILYEIPYYEKRGYRAANPVLVPRAGRSKATYIMDHVRTVDDLTLFRLWTGYFSKPAMGFHGELLTARGDVLTDVTFNRPSIVEDYAFAAELLDRGIPVWQTDSRVSILSPHNIHSLLKQRRRWFIGLWQDLPRSPRLAQAILGPRMMLWTFILLGGIGGAPLWFIYGQLFDPPLVMLILTGITMWVYTVAYLIGAVRTGWSFPIHLLVLPCYVLIEALTSIYAIVTQNNQFVVIDK